MSGRRDRDISIAFVCKLNIRSLAFDKLVLNCTPVQEIFIMILAILFVTLIIVLIYYVYLIGVNNEKYWKKRGVVFHGKNKVMGLFWDFVVGDRSFFQLFEDLYKLYPDEPAVAFGSLMTPALYVKDKTNVLHVLQIDFQSFFDRGFTFNENDKLALNVLFLHGAKWKLLRQKMSPLFTAAKLKNMFYIINNTAEDFMKFLKDNPGKQRSGALETLNTFCCAAISGAVFGIGNKSTFESPIVHYVRRSLKPTLWKNIKFAIAFVNANVFKMLKFTLFSVEEDYFINAVKKLVTLREQENVTKHDFADLCIAIRRNGNMKDMDTGFEMKPTYETLAAQAFFYFLAGVEPCAATTFGVMYELGKHPDILRKVHEEIDKTYSKYNNEITYDAVYGMEYLDNVINEALRMYPPIGYLTRQCVRDSVLPVGNIQVSKGTKIFLPIYEFHHDPQIYPDPEVFNPDRFARDKAHHASDVTYIPFGFGNRLCLGLRYARLQVKTGLVHLLRNFSVKVTTAKDGIKYKKEQVQVRLDNADYELIPRKLSSS